MTIFANFPATSPSLILDFANSGKVDPRITFTRNSIATYFDEGGVLRTATANTPRIDYDPTTLATLGLLIEEARTNSIRNNTTVGVVVGTPGTLPTNWARDPSSTGLSSEIVGTGVDSGITYIDFRVFGTAATASFFAVYFESGTQIVAATGETWTNSFYLKLAGGSTSGLDSSRFPAACINENTAAGAYVTGQEGTGVIPTAAWQRATITRTLNGGATVARVLPFILFRVNNGAAINITLRIGLPQLERGAFATSVIPTSSGAVIREADTARMTILSPWFNATEGTIIADSTINYTVPATSFPAMLGFTDGTNQNRIEVGYITSNVSSLGVIVGSVVQAEIYPVILSANRRTAAAYKLNDFAACSNGGTVGTDTSGTLPTVTQLNIGSLANANRINGYIRRITYYPVRLPNAQLQSLTIT